MCSNETDSETPSPGDETLNYDIDVPNNNFDQEAVDGVVPDNAEDGAVPDNEQVEAVNVEQGGPANTPNGELNEDAP